ncbi:MAG: ATP-binding protein [Gemmatimonadota bacterium]|nr:ATP-binding protein [Gemmatimonadota bacterium]
MSATSDLAPTDRPRYLGARLVALLGLRVPDDAFERRAQRAIVLVQAATAFSFVVQTLVVAATEDLTSPAIRGRLVAISVTALVLVGILFVSRAGRLRLSGRITAGFTLLLLLAFGRWTGLRASPSAFVFCTGIIGALVLVESPRLIKWWVAAFLAVFTVGILTDPIWPVAPSRASALSGVILSVTFFTMYMKEFRDTLMEGIASLTGQTARLSESNRELEAALRARDALSEQLANAQRLEAMGRMAGSIAHDFNNQLTVIRGYADLVAKGVTPGTPRQAEVEQLANAVTRASSITREVLDFASPHALPLEATDVAALARALTPDLTQLLAPAVTLRVELPSSSVYAMADRAQLERLLMNLTLNARDVTPPGGSVVLTVQAVDQRVVCRVVDRGPGVPVTLREQIFEPFFTTKGTTGGTGLGLASAFVIARKHGGTLQLGDTPGGGATFTLELPRLAPPGRNGAGAKAGTTPTATLAAIPDRPAVVAAMRDAPPAAADLPVRVRARAPLPPAPPAPEIEIPDDTSALLAGMAVLVVEDDLLLSALVARFLEAAGATVHAIDNGEDAVTYVRGAIAAETPLDLVVTDLRMPRGSGAHVIAAAREREVPLPIVAMSGYLDDAVVAALAARRVLYFLAKPFSERQLHVAIAVARQYARAAVGR